MNFTWKKFLAAISVVAASAVTAYFGQPETPPGPAHTSPKK